MVCGNEITPRRVVAGSELSEGMTFRFEPLKGVRSGREQS